LVVSFIVEVKGELHNLHNISNGIKNLSLDEFALGNTRIDKFNKFLDVALLLVVVSNVVLFVEDLRVDEFLIVEDVVVVLVVGVDAQDGVVFLV
jgi:hypothetical protein